MVVGFRFKHGITLHLEVESIEMIDKQACIWCSKGSASRGCRLIVAWAVHPHGTSIGLGYSLNGAIRFKAKCGTKSVSSLCAPKQLIQQLMRLCGEWLRLMWLLVAGMCLMSLPPGFLLSGSQISLEFR